MAKRTAYNGILTALAMIFSYVEALLPPPVAVPGMKLGLANLVVILTLFVLGEKSAILINLMRILLSGFMFGTGISIVYSLAGGALSLGVMILLKRAGIFGRTGISMAGGACHNAGQILAAMVMMRTTSLLWYLLILWASGMASGLLIGLLAAWLTGRFKRALGVVEDGSRNGAVRRKAGRSFLLPGVLALVFLILCAAVFLLSGRGTRVVVSSGARQVGVYSLDSDQQVEILAEDGGVNRLVIEGGTAYISHADCPDRLCEKMGRIRLPGQSLVCLPHALVVTIEGDRGQNPDTYIR